MPFEGEGEPITSAEIRARGSISVSLKKRIRIGEVKVAMNDDHKQVYVRSKVPKRPPQSVLDEMDANPHRAIKRAGKTASKKPKIHP